MTDLMERIAAAPITWGVDGSPGWGHLMSPQRVLSEMRACGLSATELGPEGFLPGDPAELVEFLAGFSLSLVGGFVPVVLHRRDGFEDQLAYVNRAARQLAGGGAAVVLLAASSHQPGYDTPVDLDADDWGVLLSNLAVVDEAIAAHGLRTALHPHWGMAVLDPRQIDSVLSETSVGLCLDTGHVHLGGGDPVEIARQVGDRVIHAHLKDVDPTLARRVMDGEIPFRDATLQGLFVRIGTGAVDIAGVVRVLETNGYRGWYALEQDSALAGEPAPAEGPIVDASASVEYLASIARDL